MKVRNRRRRRPIDPFAVEVADVREKAAQLGIRLSGETLDARLPQARCTEVERERAERHAEAEGISLSEYVRRCVAARGYVVEVAE